MAGLRVRQDGRSRIVALQGARVSLGRASDNDVVLADRTVSRYHAVITERRDDWYITDLGSHNDTLVNGAPVVTRKLAHRDRLRLGDHELTFLDESSASSELRVPARYAGGGSVTETLRLSDFAPEALGAEGALPGGAAREDHRLVALLSLAKLAISVRSLEALCNGVVDVVRRALSVDRVVPIIETRRHGLRPYLPWQRDFADQMGEVDLNLELLEKCRQEGLAAAWSAGQGGPHLASAPIRVGAQNHGFLYCERGKASRPFANRDLTYLLAAAMQTGLAVEHVRAYNRIARRAGSLSRQLAERYNMVGESEPMQQVYRLIRKMAPTDAGVLICGESGTGKEMVARAIHRHSRRSEGPLEIVNCGAVPPALLESELFGHVRGAFTGAVADKPGRFELADGGTLFLDEVLELTVDCQTKLLRALEEGTVRRVGDTSDRVVDARLVAATNRDPAEAIERGKLREDLFYRLDRLRINLPPLRDRPGDVQLLAEYFLDRASHETARQHDGFSARAMEALCAYHWPGNVRELQNVVERMALLGEGRTLGFQDLPAELREAVGADRDQMKTIREVEREQIVRALKHAEGNKSRAAELLGIHRSTLYAKIEQYDIET